MFKRLFTASLTFAAIAGAQAASDPAAAPAALARATTAYEAFQVEKALSILDSLMLRRDQLTPAEAARAHTLYGAGNAVMDRQQQAMDHFVNALKLDATIMLDPKKHSVAEISALERARQAWLSGMSREALQGALQASRFAALRLGTPTADATLAVNGIEIAPIASVGWFYIPGGQPVAVSVRAKGCAVSWDTTMTVAVAQQVTVGRRLTSGCTPRPFTAPARRPR